jgi:replication initiation protein RepC
MSISLHHKGLPNGVKPWDVIALVKFTAKLAERKKRVSATAVALLEYLVAACRKEDFQPGRMCGVWEQPSTIAANLGISTKVYHDAEAELRQRGFVVRTHNAHARRYGERRDGVIVQISGLSLARCADPKSRGDLTARTGLQDCPNRKAGGDKIGLGSVVGAY